MAEQNEVLSTHLALQTLSELDTLPDEQLAIRAHTWHEQRALDSNSPQRNIRIDYMLGEIKRVQAERLSAVTAFCAELDILDQQLPEGFAIDTE